MKIAEHYSHLNGLEFILVHKPQLWKQIQAVIGSVDANKFRTKISKEKTMMGETLFAPAEINKALRTAFAERGWG